MHIDPPGVPQDQPPLECVSNQTACRAIEYHHARSLRKAGFQYIYILELDIITAKFSQIHYNAEKRAEDHHAIRKSNFSGQILHLPGLGRFNTALKGEVSLLMPINVGIYRVSQCWTAFNALERPWQRNNVERPKLQCLKTLQWTGTLGNASHVSSSKRYHTVILEERLELRHSRALTLAECNKSFKGVLRRNETHYLDCRFITMWDNC